MPSAETTGLIAALTALVSVVVGPCVAWRIAKRQINAAVLSSNRQVWINTLRETLVDYLSGTVQLREIWFKWLAAKGENELSQAYIDKRHELLRLQTRIRLLINPTEEERKRLLEFLEDAVLFPPRDQADASAVMKAKYDRVVEQSQKVLKAEWERVKRGE